MTCKNRKYVENRNGCTSDSECLNNARKTCDDDSKCVGISWNQGSSKNLTTCHRCFGNTLQCRTVTEYKKGWRTIMKWKKNTHKQGNL